jgi:hypothetical protein
MADVVELWADTQESIIRPMTADELAQGEKDQVAAEAAALAAAQQAAQTATAMQAAIAHAKSLGFTDAMIAVMYPNLAP